jgi:hypothetical protein
MSLAESLIEMVLLTGVDFPDWMLAHERYAELEEAIAEAVEAGFLTGGDGLPDWMKITSSTELVRLVEIGIEVDSNHPDYSEYFDWFSETFGYNSSIAASALPKGEEIYNIRIELVGERFTRLEVERTQPLFGIGFLAVDIVIYELRIVYYGPNIQQRMPRFNADEWKDLPHVSINPIPNLRIGGF